MMPNAYGSNTVSASQNRIQRLRQQNQDSRQVSPAANNLLQKRKQMKERRMKRAEAEAAASSSSTAPKVNTSQQDAAIPRRRKLEMVQRHKAHRQANMGNKLLNDDQQNLSPRSVDNEDADDDTLVSVRRIVASSSPSNQQEQQYLNLAPKTTGGGTSFHFQEQQSYQSNYNSLSDNMHSLHNKKTPNKRNGQSRQKYSEQRPWLEDEKSEKVNNQGSYLTASSSEYDTDNQESQLMGLEGHSYSKSADGNDYNSSPIHKQQNNNNNNNGDNYYSSRPYPRRFYDDDDKTFDYGDRDDDYSADSGSYAARRWKEAERRKALAAELDSPKENSSAGVASESPFINKEDAEHFRQKIDAMDSPALRIGVGVAGAATIGAVVGPVGLLVGAAAISVGFSLSQIPEADRSKLQTKATQSMYEFHDKACEVSDKLSNTCATHYHDSGVAEHIPQQIAENLPQCISNPDDQVLDDGVVDDTVLVGNTTETSGKPTVDTSASKRELASQSVGVGGVVVKPSGGVGNVRTERIPDPRLPNPTKQPERPYPQSKRNKKVACLRNVRILSAGRIYGLDPVAQPRAWLDVVASANTSHEEKNEAMEEILILAKDKRRARILLEEGILDYIIWEVGRYLEKVNHTTENWKHAKLTPDQEHSARQAATCCVTLGKAHCAAIHTEGDLQLMSLYERGIVPEDRQVAQMLHEVPHHVRITKTSDPTIVDPSKEVFAYRELELPQAQELAKSIKMVADGKI